MTAGPLRGRGPATAVSGMLLIASTYGLARFGVGLYAPRIEARHPALSDVLGLAAGAQFVAYAVAAVAAALLVDDRPRTGLVLAGTSATLGCLGIAVVSDPVLFVVAVFVAGTAGGFASHALVRLVDAVVSEGASSSAQSLVNAGTAVGVVAAGLIAFVVVPVGAAWVLMAALCAAAAVATSRSVRGHPAGPRAPRRGTSSGGGGWVGLVVPGLAAFVAGGGSALLWTFGPTLVTRSGVVDPAQVGWLWVALGVGGSVGPLTSTITDRVGLRGGWCAFAALLTVADVGLARSLSGGGTVVACGAMAVFGAGYMCLSGALILWAREVCPGRAGAATSVLFIALAVGQAVGSVGFGASQEHLASQVLALVAAGLCALGGALGLLPARATVAEGVPAHRR
jgi:predicted MFS family arabinose efflux permease